MNENQQTRQDSWVNTTTGIGGPLDKSSGFAFLSNYINNDSSVLESLYDEDHIAGKIVDGIVDAAFKRGYQFECQDPNVEREKVVDELDRIGLEYYITQALRWERLYGGAAVMIGADDGNKLDKPLEPAKVRVVHYLNTYNRWEMSPHSHYKDPLHPKFGQPEVYRLHPQSMTFGARIGIHVHESRLVLFKGRPTTKHQQIQNQYWGNSVLVRAYTAIRQYGSAMASVLAAMADSNQGIYKIKGLLSIIQGGNETPLQARMRAIETVRSVVNAIVLDADGEDYQRLTTQLTELANLIDRFKLNLSSAAEMPMTVLYGQAPAGLNATGESDMALWYDTVAQYQKRVVIPGMERIADLCMRAPRGPTNGITPEKWAITFASPWVPTDKEKAELRKLNADIDKVYFDMQVLGPRQIGKARFGGSEGSDNAEIRLSELELAAIPSAVPEPMSPEDQAALAVFGEGAVELDAPTQEPLMEQDEEGDISDVATSEPLSLIEARAFAEKLTVNGVERCPHGKVNSCPICGIRRVRDMEPGPDGPIWLTKWRAIDESAPQPVPDQLDGPGDE